jgi:transposase InsO family protein
MARCAAEAEAAFEPRSRRPHTSPTAAAPATSDLVLRLRKQLTATGLDAGAETIGWHLTHHHRVTLSRATIHRILVRAGQVTPEQGKRPKASYLSFQAEMPNETWQSDFTRYRLATGAMAEIRTWLNDHSRYALHISAHARITAPIVGRHLHHDRRCVTLRVGARLHHIGIGRTDTGTEVLMLVRDHDIRVIHAATGELLRDLVLDPIRDYQPTGRPPGPAPKKHQPREGTSNEPEVLGAPHMPP